MSGFASANTNYKICTFHTCQFRDTDNIESLRKKVPFLSRERDQWLTQGYYFWAFRPDATRWNNQYPKTVISTFLCTFLDDSYLYDLVGNSIHIEHFRATADALVEKKVISKHELTVSGVIAFLRKKHKVKPDGVFKDAAIKASHSSIQGFRFITRPNRKESIRFPDKQQFCIFAGKEDIVQWELTECHENQPVNDCN